jgi:NitT/TauT family transport system permease protein
MRAALSTTVTRVLPPVLLLVALLALWQIATEVGKIPAFLLPSPIAIVDELVTFLPAIASATWVTGGNALVGLIAGAILGILVALVAAFVRLVDSLLAPLVAAIAVVPIVALAPILYSMFGANSELSRQIIAAIAVFIPVFTNTLRGLGQVLPVQRDLMRAYAASPVQIARTVTIPAALPFVFTGLRIASSLAVISALIAEYFGGPRTGIGSFITTAASGSNYSRAWAYVVGAIALGLLFYGITLALETFASRHRRR